MSSKTIPNRCLIYGANGKVASKMKQLGLSSRKSNKGVLIRVHAAGLNPVDAKQVVGDKLPESLQGLARSIAKGKTIGFEFSGVVVRSPPNNSFKEGDKVFGSMPPLGGTLSEYIVAPLHQICHKPSKMSFVEAAAIPLVGLTALQALRPHEDNCKSIAIVGASGGTGHVVIQVAKSMGFTTIIAIASQRNHEFCKLLGATDVIDYHQGKVLEGIQQIMKGKNQTTVDIIFDSVTSDDPRDRVHAYPKNLMSICQTRYLRLGGRTKDWFWALCEKGFRQDCFGKEKLFWIRFPRSSDELQQLQQWCDADTLRPSIGEEIDFTIEDVQRAFDNILSRRVRGKLVVVLIKEETTAEEEKVVEE